MYYMLHDVFAQLDKMIGEYNREARETGFAPIPKCYFKLLGQSALLEFNLGFELRATQDVDAYIQAQHWVIETFDRLLARVGRKYDKHSNEIWMPTETKYDPFFGGVHVAVEIAEPRYILISKALKAPHKNKELITEYLAQGKDDEFVRLANKYKINLQELIK